MEAVRDLKPAGLAEQLMIEKAEAAIRKYAQIMAEHVANTLGEASIDIKIKIGTKDDKKSGQLEFYTKPADVTVSLKESAEKMGARISSDSGHVQLSLFEL